MMTNLIKTFVFGSMWLALGLFTNACQQKKSSKRAEMVLETLKQALQQAKEASDLALDNLKREVQRNETDKGLERVKRAAALKKNTVEALTVFARLQHDITTTEEFDLETMKTQNKEKMDANEVIKTIKNSLKKMIEEMDAYVLFLETKFQDMELPKLERLAAGTTYPQKMKFYEAYYKGASIPEVLSNLICHQLTILHYERLVMKQL